jgi:hypothetical protein
VFLGVGYFVTSSNEGENVQYEASKSYNYDASKGDNYLVDMLLVASGQVVIWLYSE